MQRALNIQNSVIYLYRHYSIYFYKWVFLNFFFIEFQAVKLFGLRVARHAARKRLGMMPPEFGTSACAQ